MTEEKKERKEERKGKGNGREWKKEERKGREEAGHPSSGGRLPPNATGDGRPCLYLYNRAIFSRPYSGSGRAIGTSCHPSVCLS